jgi:hypothetical protein
MKLRRKRMMSRKVEGDSALVVEAELPAAGSLRLGFARRERQDSVSGKML